MTSKKNKGVSDRLIERKLDLIFISLMSNAHYSNLAEKFAETYMNISHEDKPKRNNDKANNNKNSIPEEEKEETIASKITESIWITLVSTVFFSVFFAILTRSWLWTLVLSVGYMVCHAYIGKLFYNLCLPIFSSIDNSFELRDKKSWAEDLKTNRLMYLSLWPFGMIGLIVGSIAAILGSIYRSLMDDEKPLDE